MSESFEQLFFNQLKDIVDSINLDEINETVKQIKDRNYLMCPNTEDTPHHYLLTECELLEAFKVRDLI